jgi:hypothetical protein
MEVWTRDYGPLRMVTRQWAHQGLLVEAMGPYRVAFRLEEDEDGLRFQFVRAWFGLMPVPRIMALRVEADATAGPADKCWRIDVRIFAPLAGLLVRYEGEVTPQWKLP